MLFGRRAQLVILAGGALVGGRVRALMVRIAEADASAEGHTRRVAALAVEVGEQLGVPETHLRELALGGLLHDMGKLAVPVESHPERLDGTGSPNRVPGRRSGTRGPRRARLTA